MILTLAGAAATALVGVAYFQKHADVKLIDSEAVFIQMGQILFHPFIAGILLSAVLAAIMSTVSSQLIVTSSALVEDIYKAIFKSDADQKTYIFLGRIAVLVIAIIAGIFAWEKSDTILNLVAFAWAGFGAAFGPTVLLSLYWRKFTSQGALSGMIIGAITVFVWGNSFLSEYLYEIVPGFILNLIVAVLVSKITYKSIPEVEKEFDETLRLLKEEHE